MIAPALAAWLAGAGAASEPALAGEWRVEESIVVVAERGAEPRASVPAAVTVLTREEIARLPAQTLAEVLAQVPGLDVLFAAPLGGVPMPMARGFFGAGEAEYLQLRVDGVPIADEESGVTDWRGLDALALERVEVLRGTGSHLYGDTALGGVVDVRTLPSGGGPPARLALGGGSYESGSAALAWRRELASSHADLSAGGDRTAGYREHSASSGGGVRLAWSGPWRRGAWRVQAAAADREREDPGPLTVAELTADPGASNPLFRHDRESTDRQRLALAWDGEAGGAAVTTSLFAGRRETSFLRTLLVAAGIGDRTLRDLDSSTVGTLLEAERAWAPGDAANLTLRFGLDASREELDGGYRAVGEAGEVGEVLARRDAERARAAGFAAAALAPGSRLRLTAGVRWDGLTQDAGDLPSSSQDAWSPRLGLAIRLPGREATRSLFFQAARAFKAPTLDQLFDPRPFDDFAGGTFTISNPTLRPQRARTLEAGVTSAGRRSRWELVAYRTAVEDEIDFDPATFAYLNIGSSLHRGVEFAASWRHGRALRPFASGTWTRVFAREGPNAGHQLKNIPEHRLAVGLHADLPWRLAADLVVTRYGERWLDDEHRFALDPASIADLRLAWARGDHRWRLDLLNLTDERTSALGYVLPDLVGEPVPYQFPAPGLSARLGVDFTLGASGHD